jgi:hypothetical protein
MKAIPKDRNIFIPKFDANFFDTATGETTAILFERTLLILIALRDQFTAKSSGFLSTLPVANLKRRLLSGVQRSNKFAMPAA